MNFAALAQARATATDRPQGGPCSVSPLTGRTWATPDARRHRLHADAQCAGGRGRSENR